MKAIAWKRVWSALCITIFITLLYGIATAEGALRKGYIIGIGGGFAPLAHQTYQTFAPNTDYSIQEGSGGTYIYNLHYSIPSNHSSNESAAAFQVDFGYAWNEQNAIFLREQQVVHSTDPAISLGATALCWNHYFGPTGHSLFTTMGVSLSSAFYYDAGSLSTDFGDGPGLLIGVGYEFMPHFSLEVNYCQGPTTEVSSRSHLSIMFTSTAY